MPAPHAEKLGPALVSLVLCAVLVVASLVSATSAAQGARNAEPLGQDPLEKDTAPLLNRLPRDDERFCYTHPGAGEGPRFTSASDPVGIKIGGSFPQNSEERNPCNCRMDDLMFFDRVVTPAEIATQYARMLGG
jgi:hypothetical protein